MYTTVKTNTGRKRININGALDLEDMGITAQYPDRLNAETVIEFYDQIQNQYPDQTKIYLIEDNARYYKNKDVTKYLNTPGCKLEVIWLPPYSPNLNLIERLWKFLRQKIIGTKYREKFKEFEKDVKDFFENFEDYGVELRPFIGTKMHLLQA